MHHHATLMGLVLLAMTNVVQAQHGIANATSKDKTIQVRLLTGWEQTKDAKSTAKIDLHNADGLSFTSIYADSKSDLKDMPLKDYASKCMDDSPEKKRAAGRQGFGSPNHHAPWKFRRSI